MKTLLESTLSQVADLIRRYDDAAKALVEAYGRRGYGVGDEVERLERVLLRCPEYDDEGGSETITDSE